MFLLSGKSTRFSLTSAIEYEIKIMLARSFDAIYLHSSFFFCFMLQYRSFQVNRSGRKFIQNWYLFELDMKLSRFNTFEIKIFIKCLSLSYVVNWNGRNEERNGFQAYLMQLDTTEKFLTLKNVKKKRLFSIWFGR